MDLQKNTKLNPVKRIILDHEILAVSDDTVERKTACVCIEDTVTVTLNGIPVTTLKITPVDLDSFAIGFLICEGLISDPACISSVDIDLPLISVIAEKCAMHGHAPPLEIRSAAVGVRHRQELSGPPIGPGSIIYKKSVFEGTRMVHESAKVLRSTGGTHCTILVDTGGQVLSADEDIVRHTSVDMAVGKALLSGVNPGTTFMVCTGRLPADMVAKAYRAGIPIVVDRKSVV